VKSIDEWAFSSCSSLTSIEIPDPVTFIGEGAFSSCYLLTSATLPDTLTSIENYLFQGCRALTNFVIPSKVVTIGEYAFDGCQGLININVPQSVNQIGKWAFQSCFELESVSISDAVKELPDYVFWGCESLTQVKLPAALKEIGEEAFYNCGELTEIVIPLTLTKIGNSAFRNTALIEISIPASVSYIGQSAFSYCHNLKDVYVYNRTPIGITGDVFDNDYYINNGKNLYVRSRSIPLYKKTAVWKDSQIKSIERIYTNSIRELTGRDIIVQVKTDLVENEDQFTAFQFEMMYDTLRMVFKEKKKKNIMTSTGSVMVNSNTKGILKVGYMSRNTLSGEGTLINLRFTIRNSGVVQPEFKRFLYNAYDLINFNPGAIEVIAYGDVDYNQEVQSYDASLVLINSVGLNPLEEVDPFPWEDLREDVSDVDGSISLTATDAGYILKKSVDLISKFPIEGGPSQIKGLSKVAAIQKADVVVSEEDNELVFRSYGDFIGMNVSIDGDLTCLDKPIISSTIIHARNINESVYHVGLATAVAPVNGSVIMKIPVLKKITEEMTLTLNINNEVKIVKISNVSTGTNTLNDNKLLCYPNPVTDYLYFSADYQNAAVRITDGRGAVVHQEQLRSTPSINLNALIPGMYLISITDADGRVSTTKLLKK